MEELDNKLLCCTGKTIDELFPPEVRTKAFLGKSKMREISGTVEMLSLTSEVSASLAIECSDAEQADSLNHDSNWLNEGLRQLPAHHAEILKMRFGIGCEPLSWREIDRIRGVRGSDQTAKRAIERLGKYYRDRGIKFEFFMPSVKGEDSEVYGPHCEHWAPARAEPVFGDTQQ